LDGFDTPILKEAKVLLDELVLLGLKKCSAKRSELASTPVSCELSARSHQRVWNPEQLRQRAGRKTWLGCGTRRPRFRPASPSWMQFGAGVWETVFERSCRVRFMIRKLKSGEYRLWPVQARPQHRQRPQSRHVSHAGKGGEA